MLQNNPHHTVLLNNMNNINNNSNYKTTQILHILGQQIMTITILRIASVERTGALFIYNVVAAAVVVVVIVMVAEGWW